MDRPMPSPTFAELVRPLSACEVDVLGKDVEAVVLGSAIVALDAGAEVEKTPMVAGSITPCFASQHCEALMS